MKVKTLTKLMTMAVISTLIVAKAASASEDPRKQSNLWIGKEQNEAKTIKANNMIVPVAKVEKKPEVVEDKTTPEQTPETEPQVNTSEPEPQTNAVPSETNMEKQPAPTPDAESKATTKPSSFESPESSSTAPEPKKVETNEELPKATTPIKEAPKNSVDKSNDDEDPFHMKDADKSGEVFKLFGK